MDAVGCCPCPDLMRCTVQYMKLLQQAVAAEPVHLRCSPSLHSTCTPTQGLHHRRLSACQWVSLAVTPCQQRQQLSMSTTQLATYVTHVQLHTGMSGRQPCAHKHATYRLAQQMQLLPHFQVCRCACMCPAAYRPTRRASLRSSTRRQPRRQPHNAAVQEKAFQACVPPLSA